jgi:hypothetical protein
MTKKRNMRGVVCMAVLASALAVLAFASSAQAKLTGEFTRFQYCPYTKTEVKRCLYSENNGGEVLLGSKKVPIVNPVIIQGGYGEEAETGPEAGFSKFYEATNGISLSKASQPVPGGLAGFVNCKEISNIILRVSCEAIFENGLTGVNSTLELARPASEIRVSEIHLAEEIGVALKLPVKFRLENPLFGSSCYVGSSSSPVIWNLTAGTTSPPGPNKPIKGSGGVTEFFEEGQILKLKGAELVDNAWAAPKAEGCGGIFSFILDPIVNASSGLPAAAGKNSAKLKNEIYDSPALAVKINNEEHP